MAHTIKEKEKLLARVRRLKGQVGALERALEEEQDCLDLLQQITACRGAMNGLMTEVMEGHIRFHVINPDSAPTSAQSQAADQLVKILKTYLR